MILSSYTWKKMVLILKFGKYVSLLSFQDVDEKINLELEGHC